MGSPWCTRLGPSEPEDALILVAADALIRTIAELRSQVAHDGTHRAVVQVLLVEAHVFEAVRILRAIPSQPRLESTVVPAISPSAAA